MFRDSVEIDELKYPIRVREIRIRAGLRGRRPPPRRARRDRGLRPEARHDDGRLRDRRALPSAARHPGRRRRGLLGALQAARRRQRGAAAADLPGGHRSPARCSAIASRAVAATATRTRASPSACATTCSPASSPSRARETSTGSRSPTGPSTTRSRVDEAETARLRGGGAMTDIPRLPARRQGRDRHGRELGHRRGHRRGDGAGGRAASCSWGATPSGSPSVAAAVRRRRSATIVARHDGRRRARAHRPGRAGRVRPDRRDRPLGRRLLAQAVPRVAGRVARRRSGRQRARAVRDHARGAGASARGLVGDLHLLDRGQARLPATRAAYCATKGAIEMLVSRSATEFAPRGVRVNAIAPGNIHSPMNEEYFRPPEYERVDDRAHAGRPRGRRRGHRAGRRSSSPRTPPATSTASRCSSTAAGRPDVAARAPSRTAAALVSIT